MIVSREGAHGCALTLLTGTSDTKVKPKLLNAPLVAGSGIAYNQIGLGPN